jgi:hypothetical protein
MTSLLEFLKAHNIDFSKILYVTDGEYICSFEEFCELNDLSNPNGFQINPRIQVVGAKYWIKFKDGKWKMYEKPYYPVKNGVPSLYVQRGY